MAIQSWNGWLATVSGKSEAELRGRSLLELVESESRDQLRELFEEVLHSGASRVLASAFHHYLIRCAPQQPSTHFTEMQQLVTVAPWRDGEMLRGLVVTIEDVTARRDEERSLAERLRTNERSALLAGIRAGDWRIRGEAVRRLSATSDEEIVAEALHSLEGQHLDLNVLSSTLQVLIAAKRDVLTPLYTLLSDDSANLRMHAAQALGLIADRRAAPRLIEALNDPDANVRFHAIEALGRLRDPDAVQPLVALAEADDFFLAFPAIDALALIDDPSAAPGLITLLERSELRPAVVDALGVMGDEDSVAPLMRGLDDGTLDAAPVAAALAAICDRYDGYDRAGLQIKDRVRALSTAAVIDRLIDALANRREPRSAVIRVLGWMGPAAAAAVASTIGESSFRVEIAEAVEAIGRSAVAPLIAELREGSREAKLAAATLLGRLGDRQATPALIDAAAQGDAELSAAAASSLAALGDPRALDTLFTLFADTQTAVRRAAMAAVNSIGAANTEAKVVEGLASSNPRVRESSVRVAGYFGFERCAETLLAALDDSDESVRRAAIEQLPLRGDLAGVSGLEKALHEESARNRAAAAHAFKLIEAADAEAALVSALQDADPWVRYFAADALCVHGRAVAIDALRSVAEDDPATHVRIAALRALSELHASTCHEIARSLLASGEDDVTSAALAALADATEADTEDILAEHARGSRPAVRLAAIEVLGRRGTDRAMTALADAARLPVTPPLGDDAIRALSAAATRPGAAQRRAIEALMALGIDDELRPLVIDACAGMPASVIAWLREPLGAPQPAIRQLAVECLARLRHPAASEAILTALGDPDVAVRTAALTAVSRLGPLTAANAVAALAQRDPDRSIRRRASAACERHGWNQPRRESES